MSNPAAPVSQMDDTQNAKPCSSFDSGKGKPRRLRKSLSSASSSSISSSLSSLSDSLNSAPKGRRHQSYKKSSFYNHKPSKGVSNQANIRPSISQSSSSSSSLSSHSSSSQPHQGVKIESSKTRSSTPSTIACTHSPALELESDDKEDRRKPKRKKSDLDQRAEKRQKASPTDSQTLSESSSWSSSENFHPICPRSAKKKMLRHYSKSKLSLRNRNLSGQDATNIDNFSGDSISLAPSSPCSTVSGVSAGACSVDEGDIEKRRRCEELASAAVALTQFTNRLSEILQRVEDLDLLLLASEANGVGVSISCPSSSHVAPSSPSSDASRLSNPEKVKQERGRKESKHRQVDNAKNKQRYQRSTDDYGSHGASSSLDSSDFSHSKSREDIYNETRVHKADYLAPSDYLPSSARLSVCEAATLCSESAQIRVAGSMSTVPTGRLVRFLTLLLINMRDAAMLAPQPPSQVCPVQSYRLNTFIQRSLIIKSCILNA
ncbi:unnamed protein product [Protopolystoma xenopodis]|uniref:Uncharacterized protein n=1 Tax=Protopolystoma xenopodis TaxID=117903 RepID=A0A3S5BUK0_9PLAT|nr:unnamed protein product [Protopolystoma xenopodis]